MEAFLLRKRLAGSPRFRFILTIPDQESYDWMCKSLRNTLLLFHQNIPGEHEYCRGRLCVITAIKGGKERDDLAQRQELLSQVEMTFAWLQRQQMFAGRLLGTKPGNLCLSSPMALSIRQRTLRGDR